MSGNGLEAVFQGRECRPHELIEVLQDVNDADGHISEQAMRGISERLNVPLIETYRVANFYKSLSLRPRGKHVLTCCMGTACHVRGAQLLLDEAANQLGIEPGETTEDGLFTVERVNCLGACALGPVVAVNDVYHGHMTPAKLRRLIAEIQRVEKEVPSHA
jgi:NADH:ubiquinone oxidoreductase subunit E